MKLRFRSLTKKQKSKFCNGCGGKGGWFNPPDFIFKDSCDHHDFNYWLGGSEEDRKKADMQFYHSMRSAANLELGPKRYLFKILAWVYYKAVRLFASKYFYYSKKERTLDDLYGEING